MGWMLRPLRHYADFGGRSLRVEYWSFWLFLLVGSLVATTLDVMLGLGGGRTSTLVTGPGLWSSSTFVVAGWLARLFALAMIVPHLAVSVRRLHDVGRSGFWLLILFVPLFGWVVLLVFLLTDGTRGPNRFGPDPKDAPLPLR